jgi:hypothetical protein
MHKEFPRLFGRVPFIASRPNEITVGLGRYALSFGKWFVYLEVC